LRRNSIKAGRPVLSTDCDRLAGKPDDPGRVGEGAKWRGLDADEAIAAFTREAQLNPGEPRFRYQLARAVRKRGRSGDEQQALDAAAQLLIPLVREG
jgi:hypothetical protein